MQPDKPWFANYASLREQVEDRRHAFEARCTELQLAPASVLAEFSRDILARAVHESNWQEGLELDKGRTRELAEAAFDDYEDIAGPHLDLSRILRSHRNAVVGLKTRGQSIEELAAYNLAKAHSSLRLIGAELAQRQSASLAQALRTIESLYPQIRDGLPEEARARIEKGFALVRSLTADETSVGSELTEMPVSTGALLEKLLKLEPDALLNPMRTAYVHFFHRITLMGIAPIAQTGRWRPTSVHVGNPDLIFPVPSAVPALMKEFCKGFPTVLPTTVKYDPVLMAAKASHQFVSIHPYFDGNGRVSRLLMNLVLWGHFPPVYLKADKKGRHRYAQALRRADRGNLEPLAALIATSLLEIYDRILHAMRAA